MSDGAFQYIPRKPEESVLYQVVADQLETFVARREERDRAGAGVVEREFRDYLNCGVPAHGFLRLHCGECGRDRILPFSCKERGICPSCGGRRMADTAAHLVDIVFPWVPVHQWVLSLPFKLRYRMAYDSALMADVLNIFFGILGPAAKWRAWIVLKPSVEAGIALVPVPASGPCGLTSNERPQLTGVDVTPPCNYAWALLMMRVLQLDFCSVPTAAAGCAFSPPCTRPKPLEKFWTASA